MRIATTIAAWGRSARGALRPASAISVAALALAVFVPVTTQAASLFSIFECATDPVACAVTGTGFAIYSLMSFLLGMIGWLFNQAIILTVFEFSTFLGNNEGILAGWMVIRDVCNIALLFGFIFMGISTILNIHGYEMKKTLPRLIIFAVLLNFSLLATQTIIDTSNIFAHQLYKQSGTCATSTNRGECDSKVGTSGAIMEMTNMADSLSIGWQQEKGFIFYIGLALLEIILIMVLLAGAIMLFTRAVVLVFLMVLSPIGFAGLAVPFLEKYAKLWWDKLLSQSFFAPIFLLLLFVGLKISEGITAEGQLGALFVGDTGPSSIDMFIVFGVTVGFMIMALVTSKQMGAMGASFAISASRKVVTYPLAVAGRSTVGYGASKLAPKWDATMGRINRSTGVGGRTASWLLRNTGVDESIHSGLKATSGAKIGGFASYDDRTKELKARKSETLHAMDSADNAAALDKNSKILTNANSTQAEKDTARDAIAELTQKMSLHDLEVAIREGSKEQITALSKAMSPEKFEKLLDNKEIGEDLKHAMQHDRYEDVDATNVKGLTKKDFELLAKADANKFQTLITGTDPVTGKSHLKEEQLEALKNNEKLTKQQRDFANESTAVKRVEAHLNAGNSGAAKIIALDMNPEQMAKLEEKHLTNPDIMDTMTQADLEAIMSSKKLKNPSVIGSHLKAKHAASPNDPRLQGIDKYFGKNALASGFYGY